MKSIIIIALVVLLIAVIYKKRKSLNKSLNNEIAGIKDLNQTNPEIEILKKRYSAMDSEELFNIVENNKLTDSELNAINKILQERQITPNQFNS